MHLKVFVKLKKNLKTLLSGQKNPKKTPKKNPKKPKKPKPGFFPTLVSAETTAAAGTPEECQQHAGRTPTTAETLTKLEKPCENSRYASDKDKLHISSIYSILFLCTVNKSFELRYTKYKTRRTKYAIGEGGVLFCLFPVFFGSEPAVWKCLLQNSSLSKHTVRSGFIRLLFYQLPLFELPLSFFQEKRISSGLVERHLASSHV
jgi:hypothetical protein